VQGGFKLIRNLLAKKEIKQYYGSRETPEEIRVTGAAEKLEETLEETLFNPLFQAEMKSKGYKGAAELMHRLQGVFAWQCVNEVFSDDSINQLVELYVNNEKMRTWFLAQNHYAVEEIARRFLELEKRGKWQADPGILKELKQSYLLLEGDMEERLSESKGEIQAGTIEIINQEQIEDWKAKLHFVDELLAEN
jgi:cobaltochelatase CobN